jgi:hypothetical protein
MKRSLPPLDPLTYRELVWLARTFATEPFRAHWPNEHGYYVDYETLDQLRMRGLADRWKDDDGSRYLYRITPCGYTLVFGRPNAEGEGDAGVVDGPDEGAVSVRRRCAPATG